VFTTTYTNHLRVVFFCPNSSVVHHMTVHKHVHQFSFYLTISLVFTNIHLNAAFGCSKNPTDPQAAVRPSPQAGDVTATKSDWGRREPLFNNQQPMLLTRLCGVFVRLNRIRGQGRGSARHPRRIQSAKARYTVNRVRRRRPRTETVTPVGIPASEPL
jgi:hypothetical protein